MLSTQFSSFQCTRALRRNAWGHLCSYFHYALWLFYQTDTTTYMEECFTCIRLLFGTDTNDLTGGVRRGTGAVVISDTLASKRVERTQGTKSIFTLDFPDSHEDHPPKQTNAQGVAEEVGHVACSA